MTTKLHIELIDPIDYRRNEEEKFFVTPTEIPTLQIYAIADQNYIKTSANNSTLTWSLNDNIPAVKNAINALEKILTLPYLTRIRRLVSPDFKYKTDSVDVFYTFGFENLLPNKIEYAEYCEKDFEHFTPSSRKFGELVLSPVLGYESNNNSYYKSIDSAIKYDLLDSYDQSVLPLAVPGFELGFFLSEEIDAEEDSRLNHETVEKFIQNHKQEIEDKSLDTDLMHKRFGKIIAGHLENDPAEVFNLLKEFSYISKIWISKEE